jgi:hypothetical protein
MSFDVPIVPVGKFLGLPDPDPFVRSVLFFISSKNSKKNLDYYFVASF